MTTDPRPPSPVPRCVVVGGGPAGLMAAEALSQSGVAVDLYDAMPSVGRKFLLAGRGGLNLTHSEPFDAFVARYGERVPRLRSWLQDFDACALRAWATGLGIETFVGSSGRVFPRDLKAAPLLRAWLQRLRARGLRIHARQRWQGMAPRDDGWTLRFTGPEGAHEVQADAVVFALGGGSWSRLGSDGAWVPLLRALGVEVAALRPSNSGFEVAGRDGTGWSAHLRERFAGAPIKPVRLRFEGADGERFERRGEFVLSEYGIEGSLVYAASAALREAIAAQGRAVPTIDLLPDHEPGRVLDELSRPRGPRSLATHLKSRLGLAGAKAALLHELLPPELLADPARLAAALKALPLPLVAARPLDEAISTAGGVRLEALDDGLGLRACPGIFCAGEMLDWEAPTGGYLLQACFASGRRAGLGAAAWLAARRAAGPAAG